MTEELASHTFQGWQASQTQEPLKNSLSSLEKLVLSQRSSTVGEAVDAVVEGRALTGSLTGSWQHMLLHPQSPEVPRGAPPR